MSTTEDNRGIVVDWEAVDAETNFYAKWVAQDEDGSWHAFLSTPFLIPDESIWVSLGSDNKEVSRMVSTAFVDWRNSLVERPEPAKKNPDPFDVLKYAKEQLGMPTLSFDWDDGFSSDFGPFKGLSLTVISRKDGSHSVNYYNEIKGSRAVGAEDPRFVRECIDEFKATLQERKTVKPCAVNSPEHYTQGGVETIVAIASVVAGYSGHAAYCAGNVVKYVARAPFKGALVEDLRKASWYLDALIAEVNK